MIMKIYNFIFTESFNYASDKVPVMKLSENYDYAKYSEGSQK